MNPTLWNWPIATTVHVSLIIAVIAILRLTIGRYMPAHWRCLLWATVVLRIAIPWLPQSRLSIMSLITRESLQATSDEHSQTIVIGYDNPPATMWPGPPDTTHHALSPSRTAGISLPTIMTAGWLLGAVFLFGRLLLIESRIRRLIRQLPQSDDSDLLHRLQIICQRTGVRSPQVFECDEAHSPAIAGLIRPILLVPNDLTSRLAPEQLDFVLLHEMLHIRRRDVLWRWIAALTVTVQWFNPLAWLAFRAFLTDCELACDQAVLGDSGAQTRRRYGDALLSVAKWAIPQPALAGPVGILHRSSLDRRLREILKPARRWTLAGPIALIIAGCSTLTSTSRVTPATQRESDWVVAKYDVQSLLVSIPNFTNAPDFNMAADLEKANSTPPPPSTAPASTSPSRAPLVGSLIQLIQQTVAPETWKSEGGRGEVREESGQLIVTQTQANQEAILRLLNQLQEIRGLQIAVETRFLKGDAVLAEWERSHPQTWTDHGDAAMSGSYLSDDDLNSLLAAVLKNTTASSITAPRVTLFNGQRAYVLVATSRAYVKDMTLVKSTTQPGVESFDPEIGQVQSGILVDLQATAGSDRKSVTLRLKPQLSNLLSMETVPWPKAPSGTEAYIQIPHVKIAAMDTMISIPDQHAALFLLHEKEQPTPTTHPAANDDVLLVVRPRIIEANSKSATFPTLTTRPAAQP